jgi:RNA polymerase sigma factor (sigma-70 family)
MPGSSSRTGRGSEPTLVPPGQLPSTPVEGVDRLSPALESIIARYERLLRFVALRHGVAATDVREVVQEVRVRLWKARPAGETIGGLGVSYIYRTAISAALEVVRRHRSVPVPLESAEGRIDEESDREPATAEASGPEQLLDRSDLARAVAEEVRALAEARRAAVQLYLGGYTRDEIAETLGWSQAKARNLIYRGLAELRVALGRRGIGPEYLS